MSRWNRTETEYLCLLYKESPNLYDKSHINYKNNKERDKTLIDIVQKVQLLNKKVEFNDVRLKLKTLRTQFTAELRNMHLNEKTCYKPKLWCFHQLEFLIEHLDVPFLPGKKLKNKRKKNKNYVSKKLLKDTSDDEDSSSSDSEKSYVGIVSSNAEVDETMAATNAMDSDLVIQTSSSKNHKNNSDNDDEAYSKFLLTLINKVNDKESIKWKILDFVRDEIKNQNKETKTVTPNRETNSTEGRQEKEMSWIYETVKDADSNEEYIEIIVNNIKE